MARSEWLGTGALRRLLRVLGESFESVVTSGAELRAVYKPRASNSLWLRHPSVLQTASHSYTTFPNASPPEPWRVVTGQ